MTAHASVDLSAHQAIAFNLIGRLGPVLLSRYHAARASAEHVRQVLDPAWMAGLPLPLDRRRGPGQRVALVDGTQFDRVADPADVARAYQERPRTRVYESINARSDGWYSLVALQMSRMLGCRVICTMYESCAGDRKLGPHYDAWVGAIVQMRGTKRWQIWPSETGPAQEVLTQAGDVLMLPAGITHDVTTPEAPGYSVHLVFAITDEPVEGHS